MEWLLTILTLGTQEQVEKTWADSEQAELQELVAKNSRES